jgi:hypothetical protein
MTTELKTNDTQIDMFPSITTCGGATSPPATAGLSLPVVPVRYSPGGETASFYCRGHLAYLPLETQSPHDSRYCRACYAVIDAEGRRDKDPDYWDPEKATFIHHSKKYVVKISPLTTFIDGNPVQELRTVCLTGGNTPLPSEKLTTALLQPVKSSARSRTTAANTDTSKTDGKKCAFCGKTFTWGRKGTKYCSDPCQRQAAALRKAAK